MAPTGKHERLGAGRHERSATHRAARLWGGLAVLALLVVAIPIGGLVLGPNAGEVECVETHRLELAADPAIAAPVTRVLRRLGAPSEDTGCVRWQVSARQSADVAAEVSRRAGLGLAAVLPDVWIPSSSDWLGVAGETDVGRGRLPEQTPTLALSPVVLAVRADQLDRLGPAPEGAAAVSAVVDRPGWKVALTDPRRDTAGMATVLQVIDSQAAAGDTPASAILADFSRKVRVPLAGETSLLDQVAAGDLDAVPALESEVVAFNEKSSGANTLASYAGSSPPVAEFPFVAVAAAPDIAGQPDPASRERAVEAVRDALLAPQGQQALTASGLRDAEGRLAAQGDGSLSVADIEPAEGPPAEAAAVGAVSDGWSTLGRRGRVLVVVDSSGSMGAPLPGSSTTKSALAQSALAAVVSLVAPDSDMGLWAFTASRGQDYRVLVPLGPADGQVGTDTRRQALLDALPKVSPVPFGGTGLYDTTLAAFRSASRQFAFGRLNAVLVITDGRNEDPGSISQAGLLTALRREFDGIRPVRIITVAYGADAAVPVLRRISDVTGGATYVAPTASDVAPLLSRALADL